MKNVVLFCLAIILFSVGIIVGAELNSVGIEKQLAEEKKQLDSIQDIVVKNVQTAQKEEKNLDEVQEVAATPKKISPYAVLTIEKYFKTCGHTTINELEIPKELVNMTKEELQAKYEKWEIQKFNEREVYLYREIDANCSSHFVIKEEKGKVEVFSQLTDTNMQFKENTNIDFESLREEDKTMIREGIEIYGQEELSSFIEDFES